MTSVAFKDLARTFEHLERTSSSTAMIEILARFLPKLSPQEAKLAAYLLSGKLGPAFSAPDFGMADKTVGRAIAQALDVPLARVTKASVTLGDLGAAAAQLDRRRGAGLSIHEVFALLRQIAVTVGAGAQRSKIDKLAALLRRTSAVEAKYVVRTVLGTHRIGAGDMTFLYGLSKAVGGTKEG